MYRIARIFLFCLSTLVLLTILGGVSGAIIAQDVTPKPIVSLEGLNMRDLKIDLGDGWTSNAQLTWPLQGSGPFPTVILFPPSGPNDLDASQQLTQNGPLVASNFRLLAQQFGMKGIAVLRFDKRGVRDYVVADDTQVGKSGPRGREVADGESVIAAALEQPEVDAKRLYLYGWSDGTLTVSQLAAYHSDLAGLMLQGTPNVPPGKDILTYQWLQEGVNNLRTTVDINQDGKLSLDEMKHAPTDGITSYMIQGAGFYSDSSTSDTPVFNPALDSNRNGVIDIQQELIPFLQAQIDTFTANDPDQYVQRPSDVLTRLQVPVLLLDGENDGFVPPSGSQAIATALGARATLKLYPGLGHALGKTAIAANDTAAVPMEQQPIDDMIAWILKTK